MAIAIVIYKRASRVPTLAAASHSRFFRHIRECSIAIVVVQNIFAKVSHEQIFVAVVVVIPDADALPPTGMLQPRLRRDVRESAVAIIFEKMRRRSLPGG